MKPRFALLLPIVSMLAVAACTGGTASPASTGGAPVGLDGRTFISTATTGRVLVAGSTVQLTFEDGTIGAGAGCNRMSGAYTLDANVLHAGALATTEMACDPALMAQDEWLSALLDGAMVALDGNTLTLTKDGVTLTMLDREVADPDRPLIGTRWMVDGLVTADAVSSVPAGVRASLVFADERVAVEAGCNSGGGSVTITGTTLAFGPVALTKMACEDPVMAVERMVTAVLSGGDVSYAIEAATLTLDAGGTGLILRAQS